MLKWVLIATGGAAGSAARYAVQLGVLRFWGSAFPLGTLIVNLLGCLLIGLLTALFDAITIREEYRLALTVGVLGGFTTFSTFGLESFNLLVERRVAAAMLYVAVSSIAGILAVWLGWRIGESVH